MDAAKPTAVDLLRQAEAALADHRGLRERAEALREDVERAAATETDIFAALAALEAARVALAKIHQGNAAGRVAQLEADVAAATDAPVNLRCRARAAGAGRGEVAR